MEDTHNIAAALQRLDAALPLGAPWLVPTLRPPVIEQDLQALREAVAPWPLPADLCTYLSWHDGQLDAEPYEWWPTLEAGELLPVQRMIRTYESFCAEGFMGPWPRGWLPLTAEGWYATAIELVQDRPAVLIDVSVDHWQPVAPSLAALFHATADLADQHALLSLAKQPESGEPTLAYRSVLNRASTRRYAAAWRDWRAVEREHGVTPDPEGNARYLSDPAFHHSVGWS